VSQPANRPLESASDDEDNYTAAMALALIRRPVPPPNRPLTLHFVLGALIALHGDRMELAEQLEDGKPLKPEMLISGCDQRRNTIEKKIDRWRKRPEDWAFIEGLAQAFYAVLSEPTISAEEISFRHCERVGARSFFTDICQPVISRRPDWPGEPIPFKRISISATMAALLNAEFGPKT